MGQWIRPVMMGIWFVLGLALLVKSGDDGSPGLTLPLGQTPQRAAWFAFLLALWNAFRWYQFIKQKKRKSE